MRQLASVPRNDQAGSARRALRASVSHRGDGMNIQRFAIFAVARHVRGRCSHHATVVGSDPRRIIKIKRIKTMCTPCTFFEKKVEVVVKGYGTARIYFKNSSY